MVGFVALMVNLDYFNKKAALAQGNRAMPQLLFSL